MKTENNQSNGSWDPHQYAIAQGWDFTCIEATAARGVSEADAEVLTRAQCSRLLAWCRAEARSAQKAARRS